MIILIENDKKRNTNNSDLENICLKIFGTTKEADLQEIARKAKNYDLLFQKEHASNVRKAGRKAKFAEEDITNMVTMYHDGIAVQEIAERYHTSRQTISKYLSSSKRFETDKNITVRMKYMNGDKLCTIIDVDFLHEKVYITNYTSNIIHRAFGVIKEPDWNEFQYFLENRCLPRTRFNLKSALKDIGVSNYDPLEIVDKTKGRMAEDNQWIDMIYKNNFQQKGEG